ncbi:MAG: apolipoprotein N-acyltransferase, partial [Planctomycetes bacterium]|nr:apolipoprotein N-acyltransferase [Planctomycetota bacterium]
RRLLRTGGAATLAAGVFLLAYGWWQLGRHTRKPGPVIGVVQRAFPISLAGRSAKPAEILDSHVAGTRQLMAAGTKFDLVIWPETMLPAGLNDEVLRVDVAKLAPQSMRALAAKFFGPDAWRKDLSDGTIRRALEAYIDGSTTPSGEREPGLRDQAAKVYALAGRLGCPVLAGGATIHYNPRPVSPDDWWVVRNGTIWFDPTGRQGPLYAKRMLVPFSEYVPFKRSWTGLYKLLRRFVPQVMEQLDPGPRPTRFVLSRPAGRWRVVSPICYEGTFARACRELIYDHGRKKADILANLSNDGWFVCPWGSARRASTEQAQHLSHYCFRAVENRVPVVRAVNTGISASIDSNGRIVAEVHRGSRRTMVAGTLALDGRKCNDVEYLPGHGPRVLVDGRVSWYSRFGDWFAAIDALVAAGLVGRLIWVFRREKERAAH